MHVETVEKSRILELTLWNPISSPKNGEPLQQAQPRIESTPNSKDHKTGRSIPQNSPTNKPRPHNTAHPMPPPLHEPHLLAQQAGRHLVNLHLHPQAHHEYDHRAGVEVQYHGAEQGQSVMGQLLVVVVVPKHVGAAQGAD